MKYVIEQTEQGWRVCVDGDEIALHESQESALADVSARMAANEGPASLGLRYQRPS
jgi:hypothetical protein